MYGRLGTGLLPGVIILCGGLAAWTGSLQQARAMGAEPESRAALLLQCPAGAPDPKALCTALTTALQDALGGAAAAPRIQPSQIPASAQTAGSGSIRLVLTGVSADQLRGHLEWQSDSAPLRQGPEVALDVVDATLSATMYSGFARGLIQATPELIATWAPTP